MSQLGQADFLRHARKFDQHLFDVDQYGLGRHVVRLTGHNTPSNALWLIGSVKTGPKVATFVFTRLR
ncbi:MAG: hypothetical protein J0I28_05235 [Caulobacterales bacterium]|nr:hypothetical protein [Caulobacterales bacterium]